MANTLFSHIATLHTPTELFWIYYIELWVWACEIIAQHFDLTCLDDFGLGWFANLSEKLSYSILTRQAAEALYFVFFFYFPSQQTIHTVPFHHTSVHTQRSFSLRMKTKRWLL